MIPHVDFTAIKQILPIKTVLYALGWRENWSKRNILRGPCPLHASSRSDTRYFVVAGEEWFCWKCRFGGDVTRLWRKAKGLESDLAAALDLCQEFKVPVPRLPLRK